MRKSVGLLALTAMLAACAAPAPVMTPKLSLAPVGQVPAERLANPDVYDWSNRVLTGPTIAAHRTVAPDRHLQALGATTGIAFNGFAGSAASGHVSAPAYDAKHRRLFWVAENGWLLRRDLATNTDAAFPISATDGATPTDTFPHTNVTLSKDGARVYLCSAQGNFFALDAATGKNLINSPFAMGGLDAAIGYMPAPYVDELAGTPDGAIESVYAITNMGTLFRYYVDGSGLDAAPYVMKAETYNLSGIGPYNSSTVLPERFTISPVAVRGFIYTYATEQRTASSNGWSYAFMRSFDTQARTARLTPTVGRLMPIWGDQPGWADQGAIGPDSQPPVITLDASLKPAYAFYQGTIGILYAKDITLTDEEGGITQQIAQINMNNLSAPTGRWRNTTDPVYLGVPPLNSGAAYDAVHERLYTSSCNTLFQFGFYDTNTIYGFGESGARFSATQESRSYSKTGLGRDPAAGCIVNNKYLRNACPPILDGDDIYVVDNFGQPEAATRVTLNRFALSPDAKTPPALMESIDLPLPAPDTSHVGLPGYAIDPIGGTMYLTTQGTSGATLWTVGL
jgi:hypothetical protein